MTAISEGTTSEAVSPSKGQQAQHPIDSESVDAPILSDEEAQSLIHASSDRHAWYRNDRLTKYSFNRMCENRDSDAEHCLWSICSISGEWITWDGTFDIVNGKIHFRNSFKAFLTENVLPLDIMTQHLFPRLKEWSLLTVRRALRRTINAYSEKRLAVSADCEEELVSLVTWLLHEEPGLQPYELFWCAVNLLGIRYGSIIRKTLRLLFDARTMIAREVDREIEQRNKLPDRDEEMRFNEWRAKRAVEIYAKPTSFGSVDFIIDVVEDMDVILVSKLHEISPDGAQYRELLCNSEESMRPGIPTPWKQLCWIYKDYDRFRNNHGYAVRRLKRNVLTLYNATAKSASGVSSVSAIAPTSEDQTGPTDRGVPLVQSPIIPETSVSASKRIRKQQKKRGSKRSKKSKCARKTKAAKKALSPTYEETIYVAQYSTRDGQPAASKDSLAGDDEPDEADESITTADWNGAGSNPYAVLQADSSTSATVIMTNRDDAGLNSENASLPCLQDIEGWQAVHGRKTHRPKKREVVEGSSKAEKREVVPNLSKPLPQRQVPKAKVTEDARRPLSPTPVAPWASFSRVPITSQCKNTVIDFADARSDAAISRSKEFHTRSRSGPTNAPSQGFHFDSGDFPRTSQGSLPGHVEETRAAEKSKNAIAAASCSKVVIAPSGVTLPPAEFDSPLTFPLALNLSGTPHCAVDSDYADSAVDFASMYGSGELTNVDVHVNESARKECVSNFALPSREEEDATVGYADEDEWETIDSTVDNDDVDAYEAYAEDANSNDTNDTNDTNNFNSLHQHSNMSHIMAWLSNKYTLAHAGLSEAEIQASRW
jgi:hypothetical protein